MRNRLKSAACGLAVLLSMGALAKAGNWPGFRGPAGDGTADEQHIPITWNDTQNVTWKAPLPGPGASSPIVWDDRVFLTQSTGNGAHRSVICFNRDNGKILWIGTTEFSGDEPTALYGYCAATPVTDGRAVYASLGSAGVVAYNFGGDLLWRRDLGPMRHAGGNASSPVLWQDMVILLTGPGKDVMLVALDKRTGATIWSHRLAAAQSKDKTQTLGSWATPIVLHNDDRDELIVPLPGELAAFNPATGHEDWRCAGLGDCVHGSAMIGRDVVVVASDSPGAAIGIRLPGAEGVGDVTATHRLWIAPADNSPGLGSGIILGDQLYRMTRDGEAQCLDTRTGKRVWTHKLGGPTLTSTILVDGRLYATDSRGTTYVFRPQSKFTLLATNPIGHGEERVLATPAFSDGQVFLRTDKHLDCIGVRVTEPAAAPAPALPSPRPLPNFDAPQ